VRNSGALENARPAAGSKAGHVSCLRDAGLGAKCNVGAGAITRGDDGGNKFRSELGEDVFMGSNNSLVARLNPGDGATTEAGSP
ncbi:bifunctional UDP-N-acetylglucosamine diphosphorylase/glucosamine-1-phosphate N-acetyltransferase GlmU, partial [Pseudomonas aeruginosa]